MKIFDLVFSVSFLFTVIRAATPLLLAPEITENIVVIWLGGSAHHFHTAKEFNLSGDLAAARVVFGSKVPFIHIPCCGVSDPCLTTKPALEYWLRGKNPLCDYLADTTEQAVEKMGATGAWSRVIWDVAAAGCLIWTATTPRRCSSRTTPGMCTRAGWSRAPCPPMRAPMSFRLMPRCIITFTTLNGIF